MPAELAKGGTREQARADLPVAVVWRMQINSPPCRARRTFMSTKGPFDERAETHQRRQRIALDHSASK